MAITRSDPTPLGEEEAASRRARDGPNALPEPPTTPFHGLAARQLKDPFVGILLLAAAVSLVILREYPSGLAILLIVVVNGVIGIIQQWKAERAIKALRGLTAPQARVRRAAGTLLVPARDLVVGDVVDILAGDRVPADLSLVEGHSLAVEEAILTGEPTPCEKTPGGPSQAPTPLADRTGALFGGTLVLRGHGVGVVSAIGRATEIGRIAAAAGTSPPAPLEIELRKVARRVSFIAVTAGVLLALIVAQRANGDLELIYEGVLAGVALAIAAVPEGLVAVVTVALALGGLRLARRGAIVRESRAIETLGATNVLCVDKTGTLTRGRLQVSSVLVASGREAAFWTAALRCNDARDGTGDPLDVALALEAARQGFSGTLGTRTAEQPFDPVSRLMATVHETPDGTWTSIKGAPEVVLPRCHPSDELNRLAGEVEHLARQGLRVIAVAAARGSRMDGDDLEALGLALFTDPLRPSVRDAVAACRRAGIRLVLVTGDHLDTARAVASAAGLDTSNCVSGADLVGLSLAARRDRLARTNVLARVEPGLKVELVEAHRALGHVVAMMGDGVNDVPALRRADIGVAVSGAEGSDVAREAADIVLTRGDIGVLVDAVREGRRIYRNLVSVVGYLVTGNASEVLVTMVGLALFPSLIVPLLPVQLLWINLVTDGAPALALAVDAPPHDSLERPARPRNEQLLGWRRLGSHLGRGGWLAGVVLATGWIAEHGGASEDEIRTLLFLSLILSHLALVYVLRSKRWSFERGWHRNRLLLGAVVGSALLQLLLLAVAPLRDAFGIAPVSWPAWAMSACAAGATMLGIDAGRAVWRWIVRRRDRKPRARGLAA